MATVKLVRLLRRAGMKYGVAVDENDNRWRGFFAKTKPEEILQTASLHDVGLCCNCRGRVYEGWECMNKKGLDVCIACIELPPANRIYVMAVCTTAKFVSVQAAFFNRRNFVLNNNLRVRS